MLTAGNILRSHRDVNRQKQSVGDIHSICHAMTDWTDHEAATERRIRDQLRAIARASGKTQARIAEESGFTRAHVTNLLRKAGKGLRVGAVERVAEALGYRLILVPDDGDAWRSHLSEGEPQVVEALRGVDPIRRALLIRLAGLLESLPDQVVGTMDAELRYWQGRVHGNRERD
jgi:transcriptional regulator with XRE-family HTH domain